MKFNLKQGLLLKKVALLGIITLILLAIPSVVLAADAAPTAESNAIAINTIWVLICGFLVFFMQAGFAMVETGFTRAKNAGNIIMKNLMDFALGSLFFWAIGFGIMFGGDHFGLFGSFDFFVKGNYDSAI